MHHHDFTATNLSMKYSNVMLREGGKPSFYVLYKMIPFPNWKRYVNFTKKRKVCNISPTDMLRIVLWLSFQKKLPNGLFCFYICVYDVDDELLVFTGAHWDMGGY